MTEKTYTKEEVLVMLRAIRMEVINESARPINLAIIEVEKNE